MYFRRIILCLFANLILTCAAWAQDEENAVGFIEGIEGTVQIQKGAGFEAGTEGKALFEGDRIQVQKGSKATLNFDDDNTVSLGEDTDLEIIQYGVDRAENHVLFTLWRGLVDFVVTQKYDGEKSSFNVQTKTAVVGVRGTEYTAEYRADADELEVNVASGEVEMGRSFENHKVKDAEKIKVGFFGRFKASDTRPQLAKYEAGQFHKLRDRARLRLGEKNKKLKHEWRQRRKDVFEQRRKMRLQKGFNRPDIADRVRKNFEAPKRRRK